MNDNATKVFQPDPSKNVEKNTKAFLAHLAANQTRKKVVISDMTKELILAAYEEGYTKSYIAKSLKLSHKAVENVINETKEVKA